MKLNSNNPFALAMLGAVITTGACSYILQPDNSLAGVVELDGQWHPADAVVETVDGTLALRADCVQPYMNDSDWYARDDERIVYDVDGDAMLRNDCEVVDGDWYARTDGRIAETHDGTYALHEDCTEVYDCDSASSIMRARYTLYYSEAQLDAARDNGSVEYVDRHDAYYTSDNVQWCGETDQFELNNEVVWVGGEYFHEDSDRLTTDYHGNRIVLGPDGDTPEGYVYIDGCGYAPEDDCHFCHHYDDWVLGDESDCEDCNGGDEDQTDRINSYHGSPSPIYYSGRSGWLVGFEVEKISVDGERREGSRISENSFFAGWERDGSCGVEGISHCYDPLDPRQARRFLQHTRDAASQINGPCDSDCGGHINLSSKALMPSELYARFRNYAPLWWALYRGRLTNTYCCGDRRMRLGGSNKYCCVHTKGFGIEIRLPHRVENIGVLHYRFRLVAKTAAAIEKGLSFRAYARSCRPLLLRIYGGDRKRAAGTLRLARHFRNWMHLGTAAHPSIAEFLVGA